MERYLIYKQGYSEAFFQTLLEMYNFGMRIETKGKKIYIFYLSILPSGVTSFLFLF